MKWLLHGVFNDSREDQAEKFASYGYPVQALVREKPGLWPLRLTAEILAQQLAPVHDAWDIVLSQQSTVGDSGLSLAEIRTWFRARTGELEALEKQFGEAFTHTAPAFSSGDPERVLDVCTDISNCAGAVMRWGVAVRQASLPPSATDPREALIDAGDKLLHLIGAIERELTAVFSRKDQTGKVTLDISGNMPADWLDGVRASLKTAGLSREIHEREP
jgi:hypothetical protein